MMIGNQLNTNLATLIPYTNGVVAASDLEFGAGSSYFTAKYTGLFVLAVSDMDIATFEITGNTGADGGGSADGAILTTTAASGSFTIFVKRVFSAFDPSINHIVIVPTVDRGLAPMVFWSIDTTGERPFTKSTSGFFSCPTNRFANVDIDANSRR